MSETTESPKSIRKRLIFTRTVDTIIIDEGNDFEGLFDIASIGGTLSFDLPEISNPSTVSGTLGITNLRKFDYVFLFYAEVAAGSEPSDKDWKQIFGGYIESIKFNKTKNSRKYSFVCNSMLCLSAYMYVPRSFPGVPLADAPFLILQRANMQSGPYNEAFENREISVVKDIIPQAKVQRNGINKFLGDIIMRNVSSSNCKEALIELRDRYGLILCEDMDGSVQVTTLTNYLSSVDNYEYLVNTDTRTPLQRIFGWIVNENINKFVTTMKVLEIVTKSIGKIVGAPLFSNIISASNTALKQSLRQSSISQTEKTYNDLVGTTYTHTVLEFVLDYNVFEVDYPDVSCQYDGVVIYGEFEIGKAVDITTVLLKDLKPDPITRVINVNMLKLYRRDINDRNTLNKIAREKLLEIKQEQKIRIKTKFEPYLKIGMPFKFIDGDRYNGSELFFITRIAYTISKDDVFCIIDGCSSILNTLPESTVINDVNIADTTIIDIFDKLPDTPWQNF
jgi:hypothetical protein